MIKKVFLTNGIAKQLYWNDTSALLVYSLVNLLHIFGALSPKNRSAGLLLFLETSTLYNKILQRFGNSNSQNQLQPCYNGEKHQNILLWNLDEPINITFSPSSPLNSLVTKRNTSFTANINPLMHNIPKWSDTL